MFTCVYVYSSSPKRLCTIQTSALLMDCFNNGSNNTDTTAFSHYNEYEVRFFVLLTAKGHSLFSLPIYRHPFFNSPRRGVPPHRNRTHHSGPDTETVRSTKQSFLVMPLLTCNNPPYFEPFRYSCTSSPYLRLHRAHIPPPHMGPVVLLLHPMHH